jgi:hypothetical protein
MIRMLSLIIVVIPLGVHSQYTYFNKSYLPVSPDIGSGDVGSLIPSGDSLVAYSCIPVQGQNARRIMVVGPDGEVVRDEWIGIGSAVHVVDYSDTVYPLEEGGYIWAGTVGGVWPIILWMDNLFEVIQSAEYPEMFTDSTSAGFFQSVEADNADIISAGRIKHIYGPMPGQLYANLILARHASDGSLIWLREYTLQDLDISIDYGGPSAFPRGGMFELSNGDILLFGSIGNPIDCYAIKFDSEGNYLDHVKWGHAQYTDGSPWPVQIGVDEFAFGYSVYAYTANNGYIFTRPRIGWLDANAMDLFLGNFFDYPVWYGGVTDMERAPDGGFVMLGKGEAIISNDSPGQAFLLKVDSLGNEEWYRTYSPNEPYFTETAYDLEMTPDGGIAFVGNFWSVESQIDKTWIVKTDACGELQFNGCAPQVGVEEYADSNEKLHVFPNPANDRVRVNWTGEAASLMLFNSLGQEVRRELLNPWDISSAIDLSALPSGLYVLRLFDGSNRSIASGLITKQ